MQIVFSKIVKMAGFNAGNANEAFELCIIPTLECPRWKLSVPEPFSVFFSFFFFKYTNIFKFYLYLSSGVLFSITLWSTIKFKNKLNGFSRPGYFDIRYGWDETEIVIHESILFYEMRDRNHIRAHRLVKFIIYSWQIKQKCRFSSPKSVVRTSASKHSANQI